MKGDFSRRTFDRAKHYSGVEMQQGRVQVDADWNEQAEIARHRVETEALDVIGPSGGPMFDAAFEILPESGLTTAEKQSLQGPLKPNDVYLRPGRYYVDGKLLENEKIVALTAQPDLYDVPVPNPADAHYIVYLDVWSRLITSLDDPHIREVALGGPDTATRSKTIWQVKLQKAPDPSKDTCLSPVVTTPSTGLLTASLATPVPNADECVVPESAGYRSLENQLYRVEIHKPGKVGTATFKWSRENGSIVTSIGPVDPNNNKKISVGDLGRDDLLGFRADDWVEITDEGTELAGLPGTLYQIDGAPDAVARTVTLKTTPTINHDRKPKLRRWEHAQGVTSGDVATSASVVPLEFGVQVAFTTNDSSGNKRQYNTGDYWLIPARTATGDPLSGQLDWPIENSAPAALPAIGIRHHYARIATLDWMVATTSWKVTDCRNLFPPITELTSIFYLGGDGQEADADPLSPGALIALPAPLEVGVANGSWPVAGARVKFKVLSPSAGTLVTLDNPGGAGTPELIVLTGDGSAGHPKGVAAVIFKLDGQLDANQRPVHPLQQVQATLLDANGDPVHLPITFSATLERQPAALYYAGGDGQEAHPGRPLAAPLRVFVSDEWGTVPNARVQFTVQSLNPKSFPNQQGVLTPTFATIGGGTSLFVQTGADGIAQCYWTPSANATNHPAEEWVSVSLVDATNKPVSEEGILEFFCHDLSFHNRHLHGYGIVCGLQVSCGPNDGATRNGVTVHNGYAIDSFGKDIIVHADTGDGDRLDILKMARKAQLLADPNTGGFVDGSVSLTLHPGLTVDDRYALEAYDPTATSLKHAFDNTFWTDVWKDCIMPYANALGDEIKGQVGREHFIALVNLSAQWWNAQNGAHVFISLKEDKILREFYEKLRGIIKSQTFCALGDPSRYRALPSYDQIYRKPDPQLDRPSTIFGTKVRQRMRVDPSARFAFLTGSDDTVQVYDLDAELLITEAQFPTAGVVVKDIAFGKSGGQFFAIAVDSNNHTLFATGQLGGTPPVITWRGAASDIAAFPLTTVERSATLDQYFAIAPAKGIFALDPAGPAIKQIGQDFDALGHLVIGDIKELPTGFASVDSGNGQYLTILRFDLRKLGLAGQLQLPSPSTDDLEFVTIAATQSSALFAVVAPSQGQRSKQLVVLNADPVAGTPAGVVRVIDLGWTPPPNDTTTVDTGAYYLAANTSTKLHMLLIASTEACVVKRYDFAKGGNALEADVIPAQIAPIAVATDAKSGFAFVLNGVSTTITTVPPAFIDASNAVLMDQLAAYHTAMLEAYFDLLGAFVQALKDCICDHLLVKCAPKEEKTLYLARIDIRNQQVFSICNFSRRKYVHSFPVVEYWLSIVPIIPVIAKLVGDACCRPVVDLFNKMNAPAAAQRADLVHPAAAMKAMSFASTFDFNTMIKPQITDRFGLLGTMLKAFISQQTKAVDAPTPAALPAPPSVNFNQFVGKSATLATNSLAGSNITVAGTEPLTFGSQTSDILLAPIDVKPNEAITLVVDDRNNVIGFRPAAVATTTNPVLTAELAKRDAQISALAVTVSGLQAAHSDALQTRDKQIADLTKRLDAIGRTTPKRPQ